MPMLGALAHDTHLDLLLLNNWLLLLLLLLLVFLLLLALALSTLADELIQVLGVEVIPFFLRRFLLLLLPSLERHRYLLLRALGPDCVRTGMRASSE